MKILISANVVRLEHAAGRLTIAATPATAIITPEARVVATKLGVKFVDQPIAVPVLIPAPISQSQHSSGLYEAVRAKVLQQLPTGSVSEEVVRQLIEKVIKEDRTAARMKTPVEERTPNYTFQQIAGKIKRVKGESVNFGKLKANSALESIGVADVVTAADGSSMAAGYMEWSNSFFPWTLNYDEIDVVLEGALHIRCDGQEVICQPGDAVFIPKGSSIEFGTPTSTRFFYVTYPANWQEQKGAV